MNAFAQSNLLRKPRTPVGEADAHQLAAGRDVGLDEALAVPAIRIPHPLDCLPRRPARSPKWLPSYDRFDTRPPQPKAEGWHSPKIHLAMDREAVRTNFTYRNGGTNTTARFSAKARCNQYTEGPHEALYFRFLETDYQIVDFQFQIARIEWTTAAGLTRSYTVDGARHEENGRITFFEVKAHQVYFDEPETRDRLELVEAELARHGIGFDRIVGAQLADGIPAKIVNEVYGDRIATISDEDVVRTIELIDRDGGTTALGRLREHLHQDHRRARAMTSAMLIRRIVGFSLDRPLTGDTPVHLPKTPPADCRPLRDLEI